MTDPYPLCSVHKNTRYFADLGCPLCERDAPPEDEEPTRKEVALQEEIARLTAEVERLTSNAQDDLEGELLGTREACAGLRADLAAAKAEVERIILSAPGTDEDGFVDKYRKWWDEHFRPLRSSKTPEQYNEILRTQHEWNSAVKAMQDTSLDTANAALVRVVGALQASTVALEDWIVTYASDMCGEDELKAVSHRISYGGGTLAYIARQRAENKAALASPPIAALVARQEAERRVVETATRRDWSLAIQALVDTDMTGAAWDLMELVEAIEALAALPKEQP